MAMDPDVTGYVTIDGLMHCTSWYDFYGPGGSDIVVRCTGRHAPPNTRAQLAPGEVVTCLSCLAPTRSHP